MGDLQNGFIVDSPNALIKTQKRDLIIDKADSGSIAFSGDSIDISAGWSFQELAKIPKSSKIEIKVSNAEFSMDQLALQTDADVIVGAVEYNKFGDIYTVDSEHTITINEAIVPKSLRINGFTEIDDVIATGQFKVTIASNKTTVQFYTDVEEGTEIKPSYKITTSSKTTSLSAKVTSVPGSGEFVMEYPIYESKDVNSRIWAYGQFIIYKAAISQALTVGGNYKTPSKFDITATSLDPRRPDKKCWDFIILPVSQTIDTTPLSIVSISPVDKATDVLGTTPIIFTFNKSVDASKVTSANFMVVNSTDGSIVSGTFALSKDNTVVTFTPNNALTAGTKYFATVTSNVSDESGNNLSGNNSISFTVKTA